MVEVFKTDVDDQKYARILIVQIHKTFAEYKANFDLEDCDRILRVQCTLEPVQASHLVDLLKDFGFRGEVLTDTLPAGGNAIKKELEVFENPQTNT